MNSIPQRFNEIFENWNLSTATPMPVKTVRTFFDDHASIRSLAYSSFRTFKSMLRRGYDLFWIDTDGDSSPFAGALQKLLVPPSQRPRSPFIVLDSLGEILRNPVNYKIDWNGFIVLDSLGEILRNPVNYKIDWNGFNGHSRKRGWNRLSDGSLVSAIPQTR